MSAQVLALIYTSAFLAMTMFFHYVSGSAVGIITLSQGPASFKILHHKRIKKKEKRKCFIEKTE